MTASLLARLRRITTSQTWMPELDGLRFLAIAAIVLFHIAGELQHHLAPTTSPALYLAANLDRSVRFFFVLSGLVIALPLARHHLAAGPRPILSRFYLRRLTRLEPPYLAALLLFALTYSLVNHGQTWLYLQHALVSTLYIHQFVYGNMDHVNAVNWSLEVEVQFYLLAPLFMQVYRIPSKITRRALLLAFILLYGPFEHAFQLSTHTGIGLLFFLQYFASGLLLADLFVLDLPHMPTHRRWDAIGVIAIIAALAIPHESLTTNWLLPMLFAAIILAAMRSSTLRRFLTRDWIAVIGGMCYSIYLIHLIVIAAAFRLTMHLIHQQLGFTLNLLVQTLLIAPLVLAASIAFYLAIERPCMDPNWPRKLLSRNRPNPRRG